MNFPSAGVEFLQSLSQNNSKDWFQSQKDTYLENVKSPAETLAASTAGLLQGLLGHSVGYKIFRINRDLRFSNDKTPYNTHVRFSFWHDKTTKPSVTPAFHLSIEPNHWMLGTGCLQMPPIMLSHFRTALKNEEEAAHLNTLLADIKSTGISLSDPELKRTPNGIAADHPQANHLRRKGLICWKKHSHSTPINTTNIMHTAATLAPIYAWLRQHQ